MSSLHVKIMLCVFAGVALLGAAAVRESRPQEAQEMPTPGEQHKMLAGRAGTWTVKARARQAPDQDWMDFEGKDVVTVVCNGFFLSSKFTCDFMGMPFEGFQQLGYDTVKKKFVSTWIDSMNPTISHSEGTYDAEKKLLNLLGEMFDPAQGKMIKQRTEVHLESADKSTMKMYGPGPDGKEFCTMEFDYKRSK